MKRSYALTSRHFALAMAVVAALFFGTGLRASAQDVASCTSSIRVLMNRYGNETIPAGSTIWFTSVLEGVESAAGDMGSAPVRIDVRHAQITFGKWPHTIAMPDSTIQLDPATGTPQRWWVNRSLWTILVAPSQVPEAFFDGAPFSVPEPFVPGDSGPVTWTATFTASRPGITLRWAWSAAVYSHFGLNGRLLVKPLNVPGGQPQPELFQNDDPAGTPELYKQFVVAGAMGTGAPQYTGARSEAAAVEACAPSAKKPVASTAMFASKKCETGDLCAEIPFANGDRLAIYSEGGANGQPYMLYFRRSNAGHTIFAFSRTIGHAKTTHITLDGGRVRLTIVRNLDDSLKFVLAPLK